MGANKKYGYSIVLAAVSFVSCQRAPEAAQSTGSGAADAQAQSGASETEIAPDTVLWVQLQKDLDSSKLKVGDHFTGDIAEDVIVGGKPVIPKGSKVKGRVTNAATAQGQGSAGLLSVVLDSVGVHGRDYGVTTKPLTLQGTPLQENLPSDSANRVAADVKGAYVPKNGILQFFLANAVRVRT